MLRLLIFLVACGRALASEGSATGNKCSDFDTCKAGSLFRTCSCDDDCYKSGTCCSDAKNFEITTPDDLLYSCRSDRTATPVFAKTRCSKSYDGHDIHRTLCEEAANDPADVMGTRLYTGSKSKKTYWNKHCAICNKEEASDLEKWTVQVICPTKHGRVKFSRYAIEKNLTFDPDSGLWGMVVQDGFLACSILYVQPSSMVGKLNYCAPNSIDRCPEGTVDGDLVENCRKYHAERRHKSSGVYFKNPYCAMCSGVDEQDLECVGRKYSPVSVGKADTVTVTIESDVWLVREKEGVFRCSPGNAYDPLSQTCRKKPVDRFPIQNQDSAQAMVFPSSVLVLVGLVLVNKYFF